MISSPVRTLLRPLTSPFEPDAYLSLLNPRWGTKLRGTIESVTSLTDEAAAIEIRPGPGWQGHRPGQFVTLGVDVDGVRHHRCYSLTSLPRATRGRGADRIAVTVQATPDGTVSNHLVHDARPGDVVQLTQADGDFTLPAPVPERLLFITGGSGITPVLGMLRWLASEQPDTDVVVLHHATGPDRCLHLDELRALDATHPGTSVTTTWTSSGTSTRPVPGPTSPRPGRETAPAVRRDSAPRCSTPGAPTGPPARCTRAVRRRCCSSSPSTGTARA